MQAACHPKLLLCPRACCQLPGLLVWDRDAQASAAAPTVVLQHGPPGTVTHDRRQAFRGAKAAERPGELWWCSAGYSPGQALPTSSAALALYNRQLHILIAGSAGESLLQKPAHQPRQGWACPLVALRAALRAMLRALHVTHRRRAPHLAQQSSSGLPPACQRPRCTEGRHGPEGSAGPSAKPGGEQVFQGFEACWYSAQHAGVEMRGAGGGGVWGQL